MTTVSVCLLYGNLTGSFPEQPWGSHNLQAQQWPRYVFVSSTAVSLEVSPDNMPDVATTSKPSNDHGKSALKVLYKVILIEYGG